MLQNRSRISPEQHIRLSAIIGGMGVVVGIVLSLIGLFVFDFSGWLQPALLILATMMITTVLSKMISKKFIPVPCLKCQQAMYAIEGSDPMTYKCASCGKKEKTTWSGWKPSND